MYTQLVLGERALWTPLHLLSSYLPRLDQKIVLELMLQDLSRKLLSTRFDKDNDISVVVDGKEAIGGVAAIVSGFIGDNEYLEGQLIDWLTGTSTSYAPQTLQARRAMILILAAKEGKLCCQYFIMPFLTLP